VPVGLLHPRGPPPLRRGLRRGRRPAVRPGNRGLPDHLLDYAGRAGAAPVVPGCQSELANPWRWWSTGRSDGAVPHQVEQGWRESGSGADRFEKSEPGRLKCSCFCSRDSRSLRHWRGSARVEDFMDLL
jgi:hypothetical protein